MNTERWYYYTIFVNIRFILYNFIIYFAINFDCTLFYTTWCKYQNLLLTKTGFENSLLPIVDVIQTSLYLRITVTNYFENISVSIWLLPDGRIVGSMDNRTFIDLNNGNNNIGVRTSPSGIWNNIETHMFLQLLLSYSTEESYFLLGVLNS